MELPVVVNSLPQNHVYLQTNTIINYVAYLSFVLSIIQVWAELLCFVNMCTVALRGQTDDRNQTCKGFFWDTLKRSEIFISDVMEKKMEGNVF